MLNSAPPPLKKTPHTHFNFAAGVSRYFSDVCSIYIHLELSCQVLSLFLPPFLSLSLTNTHTHTELEFSLKLDQMQNRLGRTGIFLIPTLTIYEQVSLYLFRAFIMSFLKDLYFFHKGAFTEVKYLLRFLLGISYSFADM